MRFVALLLLLLAHGAQAQVRPSPGGGDPRLQTVPYDANQVVQLPVATGYQLMVAFDAGEHIETIAVGDSAGWQVSANKRGDFMFVKNLEANRPTNLTVVTDVRIYSFELLGAYPGETSLPYVVRFLYPEPTRVALVQPTDDATYHYRLTGPRALRPKAIEVAKDRISVEWPADVALPAIFRIDEDGEETLVNGEMQDGRFVIDGSPQKLVFRLDRLTATAVRVRDRGVRR
mgnify:CR=1 FL=1